jgi:Zn-dependent peptidase ImmA (M78 family)
MTKSFRSLVSQSRRLLQNPYAHIEYLESSTDQASADDTEMASAERIAASRRLLQNQYAYLDDRGGFTASSKLSRGSSPLEASSLQSPGANQSESSRRHRRSHDDTDINARVRQLHGRLWEERSSIWPTALTGDPIELLDPAAALGLLGYEYELADGLGKYRVGSGVIEVAGVIDLSSKLVRVSSQFPMTVQLFTAAHELGHAVLHPGMNGVHRDRPIDGAEHSRTRIEIEADKFASYFLLPSRLVCSRFERIFGKAPFVLHDDSAFAFSGSTVAEIQARVRTPRELSRLLANTERYNGEPIVPLAAQFRVSVEAMAIRLEELKLVNLH